MMDPARALDLAWPQRSRFAGYLRQAQDHDEAGRTDAAIAALLAGLDAAAIDPAGAPADVLSELHRRLGKAYAQRGRLHLALASYQAALRLAPQLPLSWFDVGDACLRTGKANDAIPLFLHALRLDPAHPASRTKLVEALMATRQFPAAKAFLLKWQEEHPQACELSHQLGKVCCELNETAAAIRYFEQAMALDPSHADSRYWLGGVKRKLGDIDAAQAAYAAAAAIRPLIRRPSIVSPPDFRLLALYAPYDGNTPIQYLFKDARYDIDALAFFGPFTPDISALAAFDVVINLISDADQAEAILPVVAELTENLGKPVVNDPGKIQRTTRDAVAGLLPGIAGCRIPQILRLDAGADVSPAALGAMLPFGFPLLVRPAGTHGGDDFEKLENLAELSGFLATRPAADHYVIEFIDYASPDGHFRKYRFIFVGDQILPYHLAIGNRWKVHHISTDMVNQPWMQFEEAAFLRDPKAVFNAAQFQALGEVRERIGLDYFGIDCGLDAAGHVIVFETNASMLVHDDNAEFPYKDPHVRAIKAAFEALLRHRAGLDQW